MTGEGIGYWILADDGSVRAFGNAPSLDGGAGDALDAPAIAFAPADRGAGMWILDTSGVVHARGSARIVERREVPFSASAVAVAATREGDGLWVTHDDGTVETHGAAPDLEQTSPARRTAHVVAITTSPVGVGYWLLDRDGGVTAFGDAPWHGSMPDAQVDRPPPVGLAPLPNGRGYWIARQDGAVFCCGSAPFLGALPGVIPVQVVGIQTNGEGTGYWLVGRRGEVLPFGAAIYCGDREPPPFSIAMQAFPPPVASSDVRQSEVRAAVRDAIRTHWSPAPREDVPAPTDLELHWSEEPDVSIVIPVYGQMDLTARCLEAIRITVPASIAYEVIVVDDASPDATAAMLDAVRGIRVITNEQNLGYLRSCNVGAAAARAPFLVLLNNDTEPRGAWLSELLGTARADPTIGMVGAKLLDADDVISEAGAIIWSDGDGWNYGRGALKDRHEYNWVRDVDYASAACVLVRRDLWQEAGGFDERYAPAYYEDADLAFTARELGYRVVYQPLAEIVHLEGATHGTDEHVGAKRNQVINRAKFVEKWQPRLGEQRKNDAQNVLLASRRRAHPEVLYVDAGILTPDRDAGSGRALHVLRALQRLGCTVTFLAENGDVASGHARALQQLGIELLVGAGDLHRFLSAVGPELDLCILSRPEIAARFLPQVRALAPDAKVAFDTVDLHFVREERRAGVQGDAQALTSSRAYREIELALARATDIVVTATEDDARTLAHEVTCARTLVIPTVHEVQRPGPSFEGRGGLLFVGGFHHPPNVDAVEWFVAEVMPLLRVSLPGVMLSVVGSDPPDEIEDLATDDVEILGWVPDLAPVYAAARLSVAPLRYGSGMKGKIGESLSYGLPVVTTSIGNEGTGLVHDQELLVADDAEAFAAAAVRAYSDAQLWETLAARGRTAAEERFSPAVIEHRFRELLTELELLDG
jgi:GT2 family glycosyltransferase